MKQIFTLLLIVIQFSVNGQNLYTGRLYDPGISKELAELRISQLAAIHYSLDFQLPEKKVDLIQARLILELSIQRLDHPLILDFNDTSEKIKKVVTNGAVISITHENEHLIIPASYLKKGENRIEIEFVAGDLSLNRNDDFLYTLLVPDRARTLFPCFDQPDLKAHYTLSITAPKEWEVLAGGRLNQKVDFGNFIKHEFEKSDLMSTYLFSFVAGKFEKVGNSEGFPMTMIYRETNEEKKKASIPAIFNLHQQSLDFLENYTAYKFRFQKLDFATIPIFQYGGMEHVGAIQYREGALFLDPNATDSELLSRAKLIGHETAHMWFGDLVTMKWFDDVWMKEVFAGFMGGKIANPAFPNINHDLLFLTSHYPSAYAEDRSKGTHPIRQNLDNLKNAGSLYGSIIYDKAPIMMRQLEQTMGEETFKKGIQTYISSFANSNADWNDLISILDNESELDLAKWSEVWVHQSSRPIFSAELEVDTNGTITSLIVSQKAEDGSEKVWPQIFNITLIYEDRMETIPVTIFEKHLEIIRARGKKKPLYILYNSNGLGYGVFPFQKESLSQIPNLENEVMRAHAYLNQFENLLIGNVPPKEAFAVLRKGIQAEQNEIIAQLISNQLGQIFWKFLGEKDRSDLLPELESDLWNLLQTDRTPNLKRTLFNLYSGLAYNDRGLERLHGIWSKKESISKLLLSPDNYTSLAMNLALFGHEVAENILDEERSRITNADRLARFDFLRPALSRDLVTREALFLSFKNETNREKEAWVLSACGYLHHPLRQEEIRKHLGVALDLVPEIQRTGDIFFPKGWLVNTIGQYTSKEAWDLVNQFLKENPNLNPALKNKVLQATDLLERAQRLSGGD
ncbi:MAG: peptidase M1 [Algoriphagus sp.]|nr:peptidase M1 [Algoriphagus sp.]